MFSYPYEFFGSFFTIQIQMFWRITIAGLVRVYNPGFLEQLGFQGRQKNNQENLFLKKMVGYAEFSVT